jgi:hypothetical protein
MTRHNTALRKNAAAYGKQPRLHPIQGRGCCAHFTSNYPPEDIYRFRRILIAKIGTRRGVVGIGCIDA